MWPFLAKQTSQHQTAGHDLTNGLADAAETTSALATHLAQNPTTLPPLKLVRHGTARRLRLKVDAQGARLTVPYGCSRAQVEQFLQESHDWLMQAWQKQQSLQPQFTALPTELKLFKHEQPWQVVYQSQRALCVMDDATQSIYLMQSKAELALQKCLHDYAITHLSDYLQQVAKDTGLSFCNLTLKRPKTRWGSCSSQKNIMLHTGLVLLPLHVVRYVCVHELAHTVQMNHGPHFWQLVARFDPNYLTHRQQLKQTQLPAWYKNRG